MKITLLLPISLLLNIVALAQESAVDSVKVNTLQDVVVTGQFEPQSVKKSVFNVRLITQKDIKRLAANNLADVLNQYLNITVMPGSEDGRSTVSMFGLDGQYFKVLVDNVPLVSDTGLGNNIDLTQINLDDVEQIEIIEGSMGVTHGANAVTGILNIITKKKAGHKWEITTTVQEETVSDEYALFDKGRHIQAAKVSHNINDNWFVSAGGNRNDFAGFFDNMKGKDYIPNDGLRGHRQRPKDQYTGNTFLAYTKNSFRIFYKFDYYAENVDYFNPVVIPSPNPPFEDTHYARDKRYITNRFYHHLNAYGKLFSRLIYNVSISHQRQERDLEAFNYWLETHQESLNDRQTYQSKEVLYSTGTLTNFFNSKKADLQIGYEAVNEKGFYDSSAAMFRDDQQQATDVRKRFENYDIFASAELYFTDKFSLRPGFRYSFQSKFDDQYASSLSARYLFGHSIETRASLGKAYRTPNFEELYTYFVDSNHDIRGNASLIPETSTSYEVSIKKATVFDSGAQLSNTLAVTFLDVNDMISRVLEQVTPTQRYHYLNIDKYKMWNISGTSQLAYNNWDAKVGIALVGISQRIDLAAQEVTSDDKFLYSLQLNSSVAYRVPKWETQFALYYKFTGRQQQYVTDAGTGEVTEFVLAETQSYSWMDATISRSFFKDALDITIGARNILNIKDVQMTQGNTAGGIHSSSSTDLALGYGRSYFLKLSYNLNF